jgi:predicted aminopeptidase
MIGPFLCLLFLCTGCRLTYLLHAGVGQFRLIQGSIPIQEALEDDTLTQEKKERLRLVARIKAFGVQELGLKETDSYRTVYLKSRQDPIFVVSASPKDRLSRVTWWFPVVGRMPYLGFFDLTSAKAEKENLLSKDLDVHIGRAAAYSTLGWFDDPVTLNLIEGSHVGLVETLLHEMTHNTLYVKGQGEFNEGLAMLVGKVGARRFFEKHYGPSHPFAREAAFGVEDERRFCAYLAELFARLEDLYAGPLDYSEKLARREAIFTSALDDFHTVRARLKTDRFRLFGHDGLNNAYLMIIGLYHRNFLLFEALFEQNGRSVRQTLAFFRELSKKEGDLLQMARERLGRDPIPGGHSRGALPIAEAPAHAISQRHHPHPFQTYP